MEKICENKGECVGCLACMAVCPFGAIEAITDDRGFTYPAIDQEKCRDCGKCKAVCPAVIRQGGCDTASQGYYAVSHREREVLGRSQSGGLFTAFSDAVLDRGGVVYGCIYDQKKHRAVHARASTKTERDEMCGSKYIPSEILPVFEMVGRDLQDSKYVLFTGTPCQCDGLKSYLKIMGLSDEKLLTADLICHGVPSPLLWREHIKYLEKKYKGAVEKAVFRDKSYGWHSHYESFWIEGNKYSEQGFGNLYNSNCCLRSSCYECRYAGLSRCSDLTMGDAWAAVRGEETGDQNGESLLILNTDKGRRAFDDCKGAFHFRQVDIGDFLQPNLRGPSSSRDNVEGFWRAYRRWGYGYLLFVFGKQGFVNKSYKILRRKVLKWFWRS